MCIHLKDTFLIYVKWFCKRGRERGVFIDDLTFRSMYTRRVREKRRKSKGCIKPKRNKE